MTLLSTAGWGLRIRPTKMVAMTASPRGSVLWTPSASALADTPLGRFAALHGHETYASLHHWSVTDLEGFWGSITEDFGVRWGTSPTSAIGAGRPQMPGTEWFPGGTLNYAEHVVAGAPLGVAIVARSQTRDEIELTGSDLLDAVARCARGLRGLGVGFGDRVGRTRRTSPRR